MNDMKGTKQKNDEKNDSNLNKKEKKIECKLQKIQSQKEYISLMQKQSKKYFLKNAFSTSGITGKRERDFFSKIICKGDMQLRISYHRATNRKNNR